MPRLKVDLSQAESRKALPDNTYSCKVMAISDPKKGPKSNYVEVIYGVTEGEFEGRQIFQNMPVMGKGAGIFADFVGKVTGQDIDVDALEDLDVDTDDLIGHEIGVVTVQEEYPEGSGEFRHQVKKLVAAAPAASSGRKRSR